MSKSTRHGLSLFEAILLLAIFAFLAALFVILGSTYRESHGRTSWHNNLRQCAFAVHNYDTQFKRLPDAAGVDRVYKNAGEERSLWFQLLPFVEADNVYKNNVHNAVIAAYLAWADPSVDSTDGKLNFAGNIRLFGHQTLGSTLANNAVDRATGQPTGATLAGRLASTMTSGLSLTDIMDGTSNTILFATRYADCGAPVQSTVYSASPIGTPLVGGGPVPSVGIAAATGKGGFFGAGAHDRPADRESVHAIFQIAPTRDKCRSDDAVFGHSFSSGGISVALADASVKSIDPNMSPTTFCRALCPSDGFPLDNDWLDE